MNIVTKDGARFSGTAREIVTAMRVTSWTATAYATDAAYRQAVAERVKVWNGKEIRTGTNKDFLTDLMHAGFVKLEEGSK